MKDYIGRVTDEKSELDDKINKLREFKRTRLYSKLTTLKQQLLSMQLHIMISYSNILEARIDIAEIENSNDNVDRPDRHNVAGRHNHPSEMQKYQYKKEHEKNG